MFFDHPDHRLSVARTHQEALMQQEQRSWLARQAQAVQDEAPHPVRTRGWQFVRAVRVFLQARLVRQVSRHQRLPE